MSRQCGDVSRANLVQPTRWMNSTTISCDSHDISHNWPAAVAPPLVTRDSPRQAPSVVMNDGQAAGPRQALNATSWTRRKKILQVLARIAGCVWVGYMRGSS